MSTATQKIDDIISEAERVADDTQSWEHDTDDLIQRLAWTVKHLAALVKAMSAVCALLLLLTSQAYAQDITWVISGSTPVEHQYWAESDSEADRAELIRNTLASIGPKLKPTGMSLYFRGAADFGKQLPLVLPPCNYIGLKDVKWMTRVMIDKTEHKELGTPGFVLGNYATFANFKFVGRCWDANEDGGLIGWNAAMDAQVSFENCEFDAGERCDWGFYNWTPGNKRVMVIGGSGKFCRFGFALMDSGAGLGQSISISDFKATLAADGSRSYGESSNANPDTGTALTLLGIRGGKATLKNVQVEAIGQTVAYDKTGKYGCSRIASLISDTYYSTGQPVDATVDNCRSKITPNLSKTWNDIDIRTKGSAVKVIRNEGSGADGSFKVYK